MQRKTGPASNAKEQPGKKRRESNRRKSMSTGASRVNPVLAGIATRSAQQARRNVSTAPTKPETVLSTPADLAKAAVGRGVRHKFSHASNVATGATETRAHLPPPPNLKSTLSELANNYRNSLAHTAAAPHDPEVANNNSNNPHHHHHHCHLNNNYLWKT